MKLRGRGGRGGGEGLQRQEEAAWRQRMPYRDVEESTETKEKEPRGDRRRPCGDLMETEPHGEESRREWSLYQLKTPRISGNTRSQKRSGRRLSSEPCAGGSEDTLTSGLKLPELCVGWSSNPPVIL